MATSRSDPQTKKWRFLDALVFLGRDLGRPEYQSSTPESLGRMMDRYGIEAALVVPFSCRTLSVEYGNTSLFDAVEKDRRLLPCPAVLPDCCGEVGQEGRFLDGLMERGTRCVCLYPKMWNTSLDRRVVGPLLSALEKRRLPLALFETEVAEASSLASEYPRLPVVLHAPATRNRLLWPLFRDTANLHISLMPGFSPYRGLEKLVSEAGADRILFASGFPAAEPGAPVAYLLYSDLKDADVKRIAGDNLRRLMEGVRCRTTGRSPVPARRKDAGAGEVVSGICDAVWKRERIPWKGVVDMHAHYGKWKQFPVQGGDAEDLVSDMDRVGIEKMMVSHEAVMSPEVAWGNDEVLRAMGRYPGRILGYATCFPVNERLGIGEIRRCVEAGMKGIKLHSGNGFRYDDPRYRPVWQYADENRIPVLLHTWGEMEAYENIFREYGRTPILLGHAGCARPELYVEFARRYGNVFLELVFSAAPYGVVEYFVREVGAERVVFGSDAPWISIQQQLGRVLLADIREEQKYTILVENPKRILRGV